MEEADKTDIRCLLCSRNMVLQKTEVSYLGQTYSVGMLTCPVCGQVYVPESMRRKMREVEEILEEK